MGKEYDPLFELGLYGKEPYVKILDDFEISPVTLATLVTALFEGVMRNIPDEHQIEFEEKYNSALEYFMSMKDQCDITSKYPKEEDEE
jgi:hypothetical protein